MWVWIALAAFLLVAYVGRLARLGRLKPAPWIRQFRAVRSVISLALLIAGVTMIVRGVWPLGLGLVILSFLMGGSVRFSASFRAGPRMPETAASFSAEEIRAYQTLGLTIGSDRKAVKEAWKRLMKDAHPDQGGDVSRAAALNAARDVLLKRRWL